MFYLSGRQDAKKKKKSNSGVSLSTHQIDRN